MREEGKLGNNNVEGRGDKAKRSLNMHKAGRETRWNRARIRMKREERSEEERNKG